MILPTSKLLENWEKASSMDCNVECRVFDPSSSWEWFIYAQNDDFLLCIEVSNTMNPEKLLPVNFFDELYNYNGDLMMLDEDFSPRNAAFIWNELKKRYPYEIETDS